MTALATMSTVLTGALVLSGCSHPASAGQDAAAVVKSLGAVPIPTAPSVEQTATAAAGHPALVEMGAPVSVTLPGARAVVTALGPEELTPQPGNPSTPGIITVTVQVTSGSVPVSAAQFSSRDDLGTTIALRGTSASTVTASIGHPATVVLRGTYRSGSAQLTWAPAGHPAVVWVFTIELD